MRQIKFRAWVKSNSFGTMVRVTDIENIEKYDSPIMQFTGLLDKNGKEIYEGDIITFHAFTFNGSETEYEGRGIIKYRDDGMCFVIEEKSDYDWMIRDTSQFGEPCLEIIGNIYENPELIK